MESGHKSGGGGAPGGGAGAGGDGVLCHACGYQYPNGHPSAKQRRAHRKHCGKPACPATAAAEGAAEHDGGEALPGEGARGGGGEGTGASAVECGGGLPGSAQQVGNAADEGDNAEHSSGNGTEHQFTEDKCAEDCIISNIPSEITEEASRTDNADTLATVATQYSDKGSPIEDKDPSDATAGSEQLQDVPASALPSEPEDGAILTSEISEYEIQDTNVVPATSIETEGGTSEQANDVVSQQDGAAVTKEDDMINTIDKNTSSEDKYVQPDDLQTQTAERNSSTVEEDSSDKNPNVIHKEEILSSETESGQQSKLVLTENIEEPAEFSAEKSVVTDVDVLKLDTDSCRSKTPDIVKLQDEPDSTSETADHLASPKEADNADDQCYSITEGASQAISSVSGPAFGAEVTSVDGAANIAENVHSFGVTLEASIQENFTSGTVVPSQVDLVELSTSATAHEINMVGSRNDVDESKQDEISSTDLTSRETNEMHFIEDFEEKQKSKEVISVPVPHETNAIPTHNYRENEQNEEVIAETSSCTIQCMRSTEEKEQIEEFIANLASEETNVTAGGDIVEHKYGEIHVKNNEIDGACGIEDTGDNNSACEINDKLLNEEITTGPISHIINEEKVHNEQVTNDLSSCETTVVHGHTEDNVKERTYEETTADPTLNKFMVASGSNDNVEVRKNEGITAEPTSQEMNVALTTDNVDQKNREPILDPTSDIGTVANKGDVGEEKRSEENTADSTSGQSNTPQGTDAENEAQNGDTTTTTDPASDETQVAQSTNVIDEKKADDEASKEISTIESTDDLKGAADQSEDIADKEMVSDADRNHVSLKVLLADKNVETKEKKTSTKDRVLSFRRRASKDNVSPVNPGSPKAGSGQQDWNSPARLPVEKKPKGRKQQWVPFICCSSVQ